MKNNKVKLLIIILALIIFFLMSAFKLPDPSFEFYVYDGADVLNDFTESYIIEVNKELSQKTGAQVVVATVNSLEDMDINKYATSIYEKWKIGSKEYDNGLLILIVPSEREIWIETGYGLEGTLPAGILKRIINEDILPSFSEGNLNNGVILGFEQVLNYLEKEYDINLNSRELLNGKNIPNYNNNNDKKEIPNIFLIIGVIIFLFIDIKFFHGWLTLSLLRGGRGSGGGGSRGSGGSRGGGGRSGGGGAGGSW